MVMSQRLAWLRKDHVFLIARASVLLLLLMAVVALIRQGAWSLPVLQEFLANAAKMNTPAGMVQMVVGAAVVLSIGLPRQIIAFSLGYLLGFWQGTLLALLSTVLSMVATYYLGRYFIPDFFIQKYRGKIQEIRRFINREIFSMSLILRLMPVGNNLLTNIAAGIAHLSPWGFFVGSTLGFLPQTLIFALMGSGVQVDLYGQMGVSVILLIVSSIVGVRLYRRWQRRQSLPELEKGR